MRAPTTPASADTIAAEPARRGDSPNRSAIRAVTRVPTQIPTTRKTLYELTECPAIVKKRGKPSCTAGVSGGALDSPREFTDCPQQLDRDPDRADGQRDVGDVEGRPERRTDVVGYRTAQRAFDGVTQRATDYKSDEDAGRRNPGRHCNQHSGRYCPE